MIVPCPQCRRDVDSPYEHLGRRVRCPLCGATFTVALPRVIPVDDADGRVLAQTHDGSGLNEFAAAHARPASPAAMDRTHDGSGPRALIAAATRRAAQAGDAAHIPSVGWHVMTPRGWVGPMHIVQLARAACLGKIRRTTLLCLDESSEVIQAGSLRGLFPDVVETQAPSRVRRQTPVSEPAEPAGDGDVLDSLTAADLDPASALEHLAQR